jgi:hypothetical protein
MARYGSRGDHIAIFINSNLDHDRAANLRCLRKRRVSRLGPSDGRALQHASRLADDFGWLGPVFLPARSFYRKEKKLSGDCNSQKGSD